MNHQSLTRIFLAVLLLGTSMCARVPTSVTSPTMPPPITLTSPPATNTSLAPSLTPEILAYTPGAFPAQPPSVRLGLYLEKQDGSLSFWVYIVNPNIEPLSESKAKVVLYDSSFTPLIENEELCDSVEAFSECWVVIDFDESFVPDQDAAYNVFVEVSSPQGELMKAQLNDQPLSGEEGVAVSKERILPMAEVQINWEIPSDGYEPGKDLQAQMSTQLSQGQLELALACLQITELREYNDEKLEYISLAESCQEVSLSAEGAAPHLLTLDFKPPGFSWIEQEDPGGKYKPLEIKAQAELKYHGVTLAEAENVLHLPPVEVTSSWWERDGVKIDQYQLEKLHTANIIIQSLADDPHPHSLQLSVRYTEHDPEEWLLSGIFLLFIPCLFGLCEDEAVVYTQMDEILLAAGEQTVYNIPLQLPQHPTGEVGIGGHFFLALNFEGVTIWRGEMISQMP